MVNKKFKLDEIQTEANKTVSSIVSIKTCQFDLDEGHKLQQHG
jgi:hypothetical protein